MCAGQPGYLEVSRARPKAGCDIAREPQKLSFGTSSKGCVLEGNAMRNNRLALTSRDTRPLRDLDLGAAVAMML